MYVCPFTATNFVNSGLPHDSVEITQYLNIPLMVIICLHGLFYWSASRKLMFNLLNVTNVADVISHNQHHLRMTISGNIK